VQAGCDSLLLTLTDEQEKDPVNDIPFMMCNPGIFLICCAAVLIMGVACIPPVAGAQYTVALTGGDFTSIQDAVTWASPQIGRASCRERVY
jgi:hypothetical protein